MFEADSILSATNRTLHERPRHGQAAIGNTAILPSPLVASSFETPAVCMAAGGRGDVSDHQSALVGAAAASSPVTTAGRRGRRRLLHIQLSM